LSFRLSLIRGRRRGPSTTRSSSTALEPIGSAAQRISVVQQRLWVYFLDGVARIARGNVTRALTTEERLQFLHQRVCSSG